MQEKIRQGMQLQRTGDPERAKVLYRQVLALDGNHPDALHLMGTIAVEARRLDVSVDYLERAARLKPKDPVIRDWASI